MKTPSKLFSMLPVLLLLGLMPACQWIGRTFGPKDEGGIYLVIGVKADAAQLDQSIQQTITVMQSRCDQLGIRCSIQRQGGDKSNRIMMRIPGQENPERAKSVLLSQGLEMRAVVSPPSPAPVQTYPTKAEAETAAAETKGDVMPYAEPDSPEKFVVVEHTPILTGEDIRDAGVYTTEGGVEDYQINFQLTPAGAQRFGEWTGVNINRYLAVVLNKRVRSVAYIKSQIFDSGQITGRFTKEQAEDAVMVLRSGSLLAPIEALEEGVYKP